MICSLCHASAALQPSLIGLPLAEALSADGSCQTLALSKGLVMLSLIISSVRQYLMSMSPLVIWSVM